MKIRRIDTDHLQSEIVQAEHLSLGMPPLEETILHPPLYSWRRKLLVMMMVLVIVVAIIALGQWLLPHHWSEKLSSISDGLLSQLFFGAVLVGFGAQMIDGALGMAYGITATTFLLSTGVPPAAATASVHLAEVFTTGFSGFSHWRFKNVDKYLFRRLVIPGVVGVVLGAYVITQVDGKMIKPYISAYLMLMGIYILYKAFRHAAQAKKDLPKYLEALAVTGGFVDSVGGGGWGPVVTTSLVGRGQDPRTTIGSVNAAEFFLAFAGATTFTILGAFTHWQVIAGLIVGGLFAAPFAALLCRSLSAKKLMIIVGSLIVMLSAYNLGFAFTIK